MAGTAYGQGLWEGSLVFLQLLWRWSELVADGKLLQDLPVRSFRFQREAPCGFGLARLAFEK